MTSSVSDTYFLKSLCVSCRAILSPELTHHTPTCVCRIEWWPDFNRSINSPGVRGKIHGHIDDITAHEKHLFELCVCARCARLQIIDSSGVVCATVGSCVMFRWILKIRSVWKRMCSIQPLERGVPSSWLLITTAATKPTHVDLDRYHFNRSLNTSQCTHTVCAQSVQVSN